MRRMKSLNWEKGLHDGLKRRRLEQDTELPYIFERDILVAPNGQEAWSEFYIAHATHPKEPNYSGNSRGRTTHYTLTNKTGQMTLCNRLVTEIHRERIDVRTDRQFSGTNALAGCQTCTQEALRLIKEWKKA
jgi:hypothetical protein